MHLSVIESERRFFCKSSIEAIARVYVINISYACPFDKISSDFDRHKRFSKKLYNSGVAFNSGIRESEKKEREGERKKKEVYQFVINL